MVMANFLQDLGFGWRLIRRQPGVPLVAGASLVAGISLIAVVFSLLDAAVLRPLPVADPDSLVVLLAQRTESVNHNFSYPDATDYREGQKTFADIAASGGTTATVATPAGASVVVAEMVSGTYFSMLGVPMRDGRGIVSTDLEPGAAPVVVVSEALWTSIAGPGVPFDRRSVFVNGQSFDIVGIVSRRFHGIQIGRNVKLWGPISQQPVLSPSGGDAYWNRRTVSWLTLLGRLRPETTLALATEDLNRVETALAASINRPEKRTLLLAPGRQGDSFMPAATAEPLQLLFGAGLLVLIVAVVNVANLLAARASDRERELAVRAALGAGTGRLVRLLLAEAVIIGVVSSVAALGVTAWLSGLAVPLLPNLDDPGALDVGATWRLVGFVALAGLVATVLSSLLPMWRLRRTGSARALADAGRASAGPRTQGLRHVLVVAQFALSLALVVTAGLLIRTLVNVHAIPTGLALDRVALLEVDPEAAGYRGARVMQYYDEAIARLQTVPGVRMASYGRIIPVGIGGSRVTLDVPGYVPKPDEDMEINYNVVSPGYFDTLGIPVVLGRAPNENDRLGSPLVAVINETMAAKFWGGAAAIGRTFRFGGPTGPIFEVAGIARDVKYRMLRETPAPSFYYSVAQSKSPRSGVMHVRTEGDPGAALPDLRRALAQVDAAVPVVSMRTLREQRNRNTADESLSMLIAIVLGGAALGLAAIGLFAAMSALVLGRTREIGVRMALGANRGRIVGDVLGRSVRLVLFGAAAGLALAWWTGRLVRDRLFGVEPHDPLTFAGAIGLLAGVAIFAAWAPARKAAGIDPVVALRRD